MNILWILLAMLTAVSGYAGYAEKIGSTAPETRAFIPTANTALVVSTTLIIGGTPYPFALPQDATAYDLMKKAESLGMITMQTKDYGGDLGQLVEAINGIRNSARERMYWIYAINGKKAVVGVSHYRLQPGDTISWMYENETW